MFSKLQQTYVGHWPVFHFEEQKKKNILLKLWSSYGKTITDSMFICDEATQHKERASIPRDFPDSWEGYNQYSQNHARTCDFAVYFPPPSPPLSFMKNDQIKHGSVFHQSVGG